MNLEYSVENDIVFVEKVNFVCYCVVFCSDYEEDDRDESESFDNTDILRSLLISPLLNQEVSLLGTLRKCSLNWGGKRSFSSCARPQFQSEVRSL